MNKAPCKLSALLIVATFMMLAGCSDDAEGTAPTQSLTSSKSAPTARDLIGRWRLIDAIPPQGRQLDQLGAYVVFSDDFTARGNATCNTFFAQWSIDTTARIVRFTNFMIGAAACADGRNDIFWNLTSGRLLGEQLILALVATAAAKPILDQSSEFLFAR